MSKCEHSFVTSRHGVFVCGDCNQELAAFPGDSERMLEEAVRKAVEEQWKMAEELSFRHQSEFDFQYMNAENRI